MTETERDMEDGCLYKLVRLIILMGGIVLLLKVLVALFIGGGIFLSLAALVTWLLS